MLSVSLGAFSPQGFRVIKKKCVLGHIDVKCQVKSQGTRKQLLFNPITLVQTMKDTKAVMSRRQKSLSKAKNHFMVSWEVAGRKIVL